MTQAHHGERREVAGNHGVGSCPFAVSHRSAASQPARGGAHGRQDPAISGARCAPRRHTGAAAVRETVLPCIGCALSPARMLPDRPRKHRPVAHSAPFEPGRCHGRLGLPHRSGVFLATQQFDRPQPQLHRLNLQQPRNHSRTSTSNASADHPFVRTRTRHTAIPHWSPPDAPVRPWRAYIRPRPPPARSKASENARCGRAPAAPHRTRHAPHQAANPRQVASITMPASPPAATSSPNRHPSPPRTRNRSTKISTAGLYPASPVGLPLHATNTVVHSETRADAPAISLIRISPPAKSHLSSETGETLTRTKSTDIRGLTARSIPKSLTFGFPGRAPIAFPILPKTLTLREAPHKTPMISCS